MATDKVTIKPISKKIERELRQTKVIIRHLPPGFSEERLLELVGPLDPYTYFYFAAGDPKLGKFGYSRTYINFEAEEGILSFRDKFDGFPVTDDKGNVYRMIIEFAPFQRCPKKKKKLDAKCGTIEDTAEFKEFLEEYEKEPEMLPALDPTLYAVKDISIDQVQETPLVKYLKNVQEKRSKHLYKPKSTKVNELKKERVSKGERSKKGSDIVVSQKRSVSSKGERSASDDKLFAKSEEVSDSSSKKKHHKYDHEATVRIVGKSRSDTRSASTSRPVVTKDSKSDSLLANGGVYQHGGGVTAVMNGSNGKKSLTQTDKFTSEQPAIDGRKQRKGRPDQQFYNPRREATDKDTTGYSYGDMRYKSDDYHDGERKEGRYSRGRRGGRAPRYQDGGRRYSNRDYT
ncbi:regulator of nonsense transcripts 3A-like [Dysidea avara]|uniref:regulator of nonsense transcripts 3A-like n=1 Tax=Dysidea avara TaxID=196820 RepID=UPI00332F37E2